MDNLFYRQTQMLNGWTVFETPSILALLQLILGRSNNNLARRVKNIFVKYSIFNVEV